jgi:ABC-type nitrate/sulfonate/bicarbonate transport system permease component
MAPPYLPGPSTIAAAIYELLLSGELFKHIGTSLYRGLTGYAIGTTIGLLLGLAAGLSRGVQGFFEPLVALFYPIPKLAFLPVIILLLGLGHASKIAIVSLSVFFPIFIGAFYAVRSVDRIVLWAATNMGAGRVRSFFQVLLPAALPEIFSALRVGLALSFIVLFAAELLGSQMGLGYLIVIGENSVRFDIMFAGIATVAFFGFVGDRLLLALRRNLLRGQSIGKEGGLT